MPCPFLSRLPTAYVKNYGPALVKVFADQCPVAKRTAATFQHSAASAPVAEKIESKCPFLQKESDSAAAKTEGLVKKATDAVQGDVIELKKGNCSYITSNYCYP
jgi:hypothetical protein